MSIKCLTSSKKASGKINQEIMMMFMMQIMLSVQNILSYCLGVFLVHFLLSNMIFSFHMALSQKHPFSGQPGPGLIPGWCIKMPNTSNPISWGVF